MNPPTRAGYYWGCMGGQWIPVLVQADGYVFIMGNEAAVPVGMFQDWGEEIKMSPKNSTVTHTTEDSPKQGEIGLN